MDLMASVSRSSGLEKDTMSKYVNLLTYYIGDDRTLVSCLKNYQTQEEYRRFIQDKVLMERLLSQLTACSLTALLRTIVGTLMNRRTTKSNEMPRRMSSFCFVRFPPWTYCKYANLQELIRNSREGVASSGRKDTLLWKVRHPLLALKRRKSKRIFYQPMKHLYIYRSSLSHQSRRYP